jgi:hypothetical protein
MLRLLCKIEVCLWMIVLVLLGVSSTLRTGKRFYNDSYQYLSVAKNLRTRGRIATSIVHFDTERARQVLPAPETTFPPGYSIALNSLLWAHLTPENAAWLVSLLSLLSTVPLLWFGAGVLGAPNGLRRVAVASFVFNAQVAEFSASILSEGLFTALVFLGVTLLIFSERTSGRRARITVVSGMALIGLSYWVRYAALLIVAGLVVYSCWLAVTRQRRFWLWLSSMALCLAIIAPGMIRNVLVAGTWRGGNNVVVHHSLMSVLHLFVGATYHLAFGDTKAPMDFGIVLSILASLMAVTVLLIARFYRNRIDDQPQQPPFPVLLLMLVLAYCAGMIYLGVNTMISFGTRMFVPIFPEVILLGAAVLGHLWHTTPLNTRLRWALPLLTFTAIFAYGAENISALLRSTYVAPHAVIAAAFEELTPDGTTLGVWISRNIPVDAPVVAIDGQATSYVLHRPTISLVDREFTSVNWDEATVRRTMLTYSARYLITYPGLSERAAPEQEEFPFLHELSEGKHPSWLSPIMRTPHVAIFELGMPPRTSLRQ